MRKTRPITLPDQHTSITISNQQQDHQQPSTSSQYNDIITSQQLDNNIQLDFQNITDTHPLVLSMETTDISQEVPSSPVDQLLSTADTQQQQLSSLKPNESNNLLSTTNQRTRTLGDEFLDALTSSTIDDHDTRTHLNNEQSNSSTTLCENNNNDNIHHCGDISNSRTTATRQTGRRGEGRARIVSITAETNSLGNQRIIVNHDRRPSSAPIAVRPTSRAQQQSAYVPSESSSVITSRNTSPVSLESSSASSTTTTCTNER